jgi:putative ABC transport system permease protein
MKVATDKIVPPEQVTAWQHDRTGALVDVELAKKYGWKLGDRITLQGTIFETNLDLTIRAMYHIDPPVRALYFNQKYLEESVPWFKGQAGFYIAQVASAGEVAPVSKAIDDTFHNSPQPTKTESQKAFQLSFVAALGNVKAFILLICGAVVFAILLVSANTMAMSIRSRTREVAVLKTLGFTHQRILSLFVGEAVALALTGGAMGTVAASALIRWLTHSSLAIGIPAGMRVTIPTMLASLLVAATVGFVSSCLPAYNASRVNIVEGLRHIG